MSLALNLLLRWVGPYLVTGVVAVTLAYLTIGHWLNPSEAQEAETSEPAVSSQTTSEKTVIETFGPTDQDKVSESKNTELNNTDKNAVEVTPNSSTASNITADTFLEPYIYDMREGRRNPFKPPQTSEFSADMNFGVLAPLERYDINELKLVGIMWDVKSPKAMFIDPGGAVHTLYKDDRIGKKRGYIATIREGEVVVVETANYGGENQLATTILRIDN